MNNEYTNPTLRCVRAAARVALLAMTMMASGSLAGTASAQAQEASEDEAAEESTLRVDIQTATEAELTQLPGIGPSKAQAIIAHRERVPFRRVEDLMRVRGIGRATFRRLRSMLTVGPDSAPSDRGAARGRRARRAEAPPR